MDSGREREAAEIVRYKRAAAVGRLLLGELDGPMEPTRALIGQKTFRKPQVLRWQDIIKRFTGKDLVRCPLCGNLLIRIPILVYAHSPPRYAMAIQYMKMEAANKYAS